MMPVSIARVTQDGELATTNKPQLTQDLVRLRNLWISLGCTRLVIQRAIVAYRESRMLLELTDHDLARGIVTGRPKPLAGPVSRTGGQCPSVSKRASTGARSGTGGASDHQA